jgi:hypothetical protein
VGCDEAFELEEQHGHAAREEEVYQHHADGCQLGWDGDEVEVGLYASLVLRHGVAHGEDQGLAEHREGHACYIVDTLRRRVSLGLYTLGISTTEV